MGCKWSSISCVDCGKDFTRNSYNSHNQCISEDQKYGGLDYKPKENSSKGKEKQEELVQKLRATVHTVNCSPHIRDLLKRLCNYENIPRKKQKFFNFVRSCLCITNEFYCQQMWDTVEDIIRKDTQNKAQDVTQNGVKRDLNDSDINESQEKKKHKSHKDMNDCQQVIEDQKTEDLSETQNSDTSCEPKLKMRKIVVQILRESQNNTLSMKKLQKRVIKKLKAMDSSLSKEEIVSQFLSKLNKIKKIEVNDEIVSLKEE